MNTLFYFTSFFKNIKIRNNILSILKNKKIGSSIHYARSVPMMSYYKKKYNLKKQILLIQKIMAQIQFRHLHISLFQKMIDKIIKIIAENI